jgi:hypothetical protein
MICVRGSRRVAHDEVSRGLLALVVGQVSEALGQATRGSRLMKQKRGAGLSFAVGDADAYRGRRPPQVARQPLARPPKVPIPPQATPTGVSRPRGQSTPTEDNETSTDLPLVDDELVDDELVTLVLLDDLLEALGVKVDARGGYEGLKQSIYEAAEAKIRELTGQGDAPGRSTLRGNR